MVAAPKLTVILVMIQAYPSSAFQTSSIKNTMNTRIPTQIDLFGNAMKNAFSNDDSLGKREDAGLKKGPNVSDVIVNGTPVKAVAGQKVSQVMAAARVKINYSCKKGDCGTCELLMNGRNEKACTSVIPRGKCTIQTY
ncbi:hypothetical protein ACHAXH_002318 [Discostella pseudostelligera]